MSRRTEKVGVGIEADNLKFERQLVQAKKQVKDFTREVDAKWSQMMAGVAVGLSIARQFFNAMARAFRTLEQPFTKLQEATMDAMGILYNFLIDSAMVLAATAAASPYAAIISIALVGAATIWQLQSTQAHYMEFDRIKNEIRGQADFIETLVRTIQVGIRYG